MAHNTTPHNQPNAPAVRKKPESGRTDRVARKVHYARKLTIQLCAAVTLIIVGSGLLILGFIVPPVGEIHPSVLIAFGEILTFVGALFGIDYHYQIKGLGIQK